MTVPPEDWEDSHPPEVRGAPEDDPGVGPVARRPRPSGSFSRSLAGAAARGTGLVALAVAIGIVLLQYSDDPIREQRSAGREPAVEAPLSPSSSTTVTTAGARPPAEVRVLVLNASGRRGVAREMSGRLGVAGYRTLEPGDAPLRKDTTVGCRAGFEREATALVSALGVPATTADPGALLPAEADCVVVIGSV
ncbi:MAG: LytR C-terminal domain-containing protein [Acidimicrobiia bacterium]